MNYSTNNGPNPAAKLEIFKSKLAMLKNNGKILSIKDLAEELFDLTLEEASTELGIRDDPRGKQATQATQILKIYLILLDEECRRVVELRSRGWHDNKEEGDEHFRQQRKRADSTTPEEERSFYRMMQQIGDEMHRSHHIFTIPFVPDGQVNILDLCMAPGGYTAAALSHRSGFKAYGITLAPESGGHTVIIDKNRLQGLRFHDITMYKEFCPSDKDIPECFRSRFSDVRPFKSIKYHLVFADGKTLRTHDRIKDIYDANLNKETVRLQTSQLILAMNRIHNGGTLVMLLHKVDAWHSAFLLYTFSKFADIEVFKPVKKHATRSSFYMIAKNIRVNHPEALKAIGEWQEDWYRATFGGPENTGLPKEEPTDETVQELLLDFGPELVKLGHTAWMIQANALSQTSYAGSTTNGVKLAFRKRVWSGLKDIFKDHHEGLRMERGVGYAPIYGREASEWAVVSDGQISTGRVVRVDGQVTADRTIRAPGDNRAMFMVGA
ncbi:hypothetical protein SS1G_14442 [Sclerotinia sclerotiorum 1980 UF-70]|uniref:Ribosomal RNA methyltransferase FtsJ domain-containing protein n=2 Tax=Sclerotinia sclerotiorum (strain ATCC 18683 / 1980 / Ss-1) TaxID=665079 RepID=A7FA11_SCLS1|nr:hypothetical protein SS1G_14442 [Sclerotinia sclerotiorum 1980 UF-70]APA14883.1 hypothetical protein sscle_13g096530 [Sclerotinia sclerotiorum 1980 UF-70]EDO00572.1 hypothetical protein SS1G_14442 [Sclerotinia sclerotiorum 1980 UF-70]